jgi:hypothetical protein
MTGPTAAALDVRARVAEFHARHYSANLMRLAVYGREVRQGGGGLWGAVGRCGARCSGLRGSAGAAMT